jgi:hypothetical protein
MPVGGSGPPSGLIGNDFQYGNPHPEHVRDRDRPHDNENPHSQRMLQREMCEGVVNFMNHHHVKKEIPSSITMTRTPCNMKFEYETQLNTGKPSWS